MEIKTSKDTFGTMIVNLDRDGFQKLLHENDTSDNLAS